MVERGHGTIVNVSSDGGRLPSPGPGAYPSSKAALSAFTESTSFRLAPKGVHVHVVYPAFMATELGLGALGRGLRRPPRMTTRTVEAVARRILAQAGGPSLEISASGLIDAATVFRSVMPGPTTVSVATGRTPGATRSPQWWTGIRTAGRIVRGLRMSGSASAATRANNA